MPNRKMTHGTNHGRKNRHGFRHCCSNSTHDSRYPERCQNLNQTRREIPLPAEQVLHTAPTAAAMLHTTTGTRKDMKKETARYTVCCINFTHDSGYPERCQFKKRHKTSSVATPLHAIPDAPKDVKLKHDERYH